ncbi:MAG: YwbE family protein [Magnetococcus sp. YQC-3]
MNILSNILLLINEVKESTAHWYRNNINIGDKVCGVQKQNQRNNILNCGIVTRLLTSKPTHNRGIKVKIIDDITKKEMVVRTREIYKPANNIKK